MCASGGLGVWGLGVWGARPPSTTCLLSAMKHLIKAFQAPLRAWSFLSNMRLNSWMNQFLPASFFQPQPQLALAEGALANERRSPEEQEQEQSPLDTFIWFAAPKSKISPSRKRQKHMRFFPETVPWSKCDRCGEPKRPHRICSAHADICALRPEEYEAHKQKQKNSEADPQ